MNKLNKTLSAAFLSAALLPATNVQAGEVEVLHWWTAGGEARAAAALKEMMEDGKTLPWPVEAVKRP